jgi:hypothetical protein
MSRKTRRACSSNDTALPADKQLIAVDSGHGTEQGDSTGALFDFIRGKQIELEHLELVQAGPAEYQEQVRQVWDRAWWLYRLDCHPPRCPTVTTKLEAFEAIADLMDWVRSREHAPDGGSTWITVTEAANASGCYPWEITRAVNNGSLKSNGEKGRTRRIEAADLTLWQLRRAANGRTSESPEAVERKLKRARGKWGN